MTAPTFLDDLHGLARRGRLFITLKVIIDDDKIISVEILFAENADMTEIAGKLTEVSKFLIQKTSH
jgi:hypothetical protein